MPLMHPEKILGENQSPTDTPTDSQVLTFDDTLNEWVASDSAAQTFDRVVKKIDETINSDTVLHDDDELFSALEANKVYAYFGVLFYISGTTPDLKFKLVIPSGSVGTRGSGNLSSSGTVGTTDIITQLTLATSGVGQHTLMIGNITTGSTPGNLQLQWAQNTSNAGDTTVKAGTFFAIWEELP